ncbi:MAG: NADH-quinone oxidoreductase subunit H [Candidatus Lindowbacteria bacterium RIFCSPLOWO2_12_FULL_62_27]|nr:MAG: NADH-quinone oxidoreductase subunit H [Candidatus Lindowbacteria bacterium RIFCSPLOWO2_12_FULL_62_27]OGH61183.1 MAG: NADH-quinone oxidoreductase subunit H [Candidatus Lindowbacteria bacterium RIFCSPLOWO2_02_FULL_62_12]
MVPSLLLELAPVLVKIFGAFFVVLTLTAYLTLAERKFSAFIQDRIGPNRVGPFGLLQPLADGIKFIFKEDIIPTQAHKLYYILAPALLLVPALMGYAVIPFGDYVEVAGRLIPLQIADVDIGILYVLAIAGLSVYGLFMAGWASNNKYSLLGGLRSSAQMVSYELTLGLSIVGALLVYGTTNLRDIVVQQTAYWQVGSILIPKWGVFLQPLGFLLFLVSAFAESNRLPFDLPEAENELVGGYHTEYGSMKFAMFFMGEYTGMITMSALLTTFFFGGWHVPWLEAAGLSRNVAAILGVGAFCAKTGCFLFLYIWVRWTLPRFRYDQLMKLSWKGVFPLALANVFLTGVCLYLYSRLM